MGQKCQVKVTYQAPVLPNLSIVKNKCSCISFTKTDDYEIKSYSILPNPVIDYLHIINSENDHKFLYNIIDINGKIVKQGNSTNSKIYLGDLEMGIYFIKHDNQIQKFIKN